ncbi:MAG: MFS transporter [Candidatus Methanomethylophilaceae archaeon]
MNASGKVLLALLGFVGLMDCLDGTIVAVALPTIASDMGVDIAAASWVSVAYFMMMAGTMILFGRIADNTSVRKILLAGIALFSVSSLACGLSPSFIILICARILQGIGAAMMGATIPMCCVRFFPPSEMGYAFAVITIGYSIGAALGPALGGVIVSALSWHWIFFINIPIGLLLIVLLHMRMPQDGKGESTHVDSVGAVWLFVSIVSLVMALENLGDMTVMVISAVIAIVSFLLFARQEKKCDGPILSLSIFGNRAFDLNLLSYFLVNVVYMGLLYLLPFYMTICLGLDSAVSGAFLFIPPLITVLTGMPVGKWSDNTGRRWFCVGSCLFLCAGMVMIASMDGLVLPVYLAALVFMGLTWSFCGGPMSSRVIESTTGESKEMGSTMVNEAGYLGSTVGTVLFAAMFAAFANAGGIPIDGLAPDVFMNGFTVTMIVGAVLSAVAAVASLIVKD